MKHVALHQAERRSTSEELSPRGSVSFVKKDRMRPVTAKPTPKLNGTVKSLWEWTWYPDRKATIARAK